MKPSLIPDKAAMSGTKHTKMGIALRIALMSWLVALSTLLIFAMVTIPQQKKIFFKTLMSKANSVAVSLHEAAAGAAINEDLASVVSAAQTMLAGDPDLDFLVVMKNDRFSLVIEQGGWRIEPNVSVFWLPDNRETVGSIDVVPLFNRRIFHYAQPFDYSGIEWGWIHVGLSLKAYDQSVVSLYRNTVLLALGCAILSFLVSLIYARKLVQPILRLRQLVRQIAEGDLSVSAEIDRQDELGSLAKSVNIMTQSLLRRDQILESVRFAAQKFMQTSQWEETIGSVLDKIGRAANANRAYIYENQSDKADQLHAIQKHRWSVPEVSRDLPDTDLQSFDFTDSGFAHWLPFLENNEIISGPVSKMSAAERAVLEPKGIRSLIVIPIFVEGAWWGFMKLSDCVQDREWSEPEKYSLRAGADMLGATIARQRTQEALIEAKATLERRVQERTQELETQVGAKEQALTELALAQSSLLEMSRTAGMAEVATGVLHNVGNVLNSVNVSCTLIMDQLRESRVDNVARVAGLINESGDGLARFFTQDPKGLQVPAYLTSLASALKNEHQLMFRETETLQDRIEHIKEIVTMQQTYGRVSGVLETIQPEQLMEDALKLNAGALARHAVSIQREYQPSPPIVVDKHKVLQIILNLINNAKHACTDGKSKNKVITLRIFNPSSDRLTLEVSDNGMGILIENLDKVFRHGFTTRASGHGFGLHSGALAAKELGGSLTVHSEGHGLGATFSLELPCHSGGNP